MNKEEISKEVLKVLKQNQAIFDELMRLLNHKEIGSSALQTKINTNARYIRELEKEILGDEYGKPSNLPGL
ncbi:hypothetical protein [Chryseobacterium sp. Mn2064]|uniref:hypothetical protein n=1 Tax=Chryseobacterium sp. Mn2064 TaxID=3395263 RepID=UPI003BDFEA48